MIRAFMLIGAMLLAFPVLAAGEAVRLYKNPSCGCCEAYANYLRDNGFEVTVIPTRNLPAIKAAQGVPEDLAGCHTSLIGGYVFEGHVPVDSIRRVLDERPAIRGLAVPGMPTGTPGMSGELNGPLPVWTLDGDSGTRSVFSTYWERSW